MRVFVSVSYVLTLSAVLSSQSEQIWLAAIKLEWESNEVLRARMLLSKAREHAPTERIYLKAALLEYETGDYKQTIALLEEGIKKFPSYTKYYLMIAQCYDTQLKEFGKSFCFIDVILD